MAQTPRSKRLSQQEKAPAAASSSEDEGESGEEESSEEEPPQTKIVAAPSAAKKPKPSSESDRPPQVVSKPIASKKEKEAGEESSKRPLIQRLWSEGDVIVILKGLAELVEKGTDIPTSNVDVFLKSIEKSLSFVVEKSQLAEKIRKLKRKYLNNARKRKNGADRTFSKSHELEVFNLSKVVWGEISNSGGGGRAGLRKSKSDGKAKVAPPPPHNVEEEEDMDILLSIFRCAGGQLDEGVVRPGLASLDPAIRADLVRKHRKLQFDLLNHLNSL